MLEASGDFLLEEDAPVTILEEVQPAEMEVTSQFYGSFHFLLSSSTSLSIGGAGNRVGCVGL